MSDKIKQFWPVIFAAILIVGVQIGLMLGSQTQSDQPILKSRSYSKINDIMHYIDQKYVDSVDKEKILEDAIDDLLSELDPHSFYIPATNMEQVRESLQGNFEGIGVEFFIVEDTITIVSPISGGPSEALGIQSGDKIIYIEDTIVAGVGITNNDVIKKLRGKKGTKVNVKIARSGIKKLLSYKITRDEIPIYSVDVAYMMDDEVGYLKVNRFSATTHQEFVDKLYDLKKQGMTKLILDLRQNPGGYLEAATKIADEFLDGRKLVVYTQGKSYKRRNYVARKPGAFEKGDLIVLTDQGSASASEIVAGAIQDWDRGLIMGRRTFGKGLVQDQYDLKDGSALRLTVARYYTPSGRDIQKPYGKGRENYYGELAERFNHGEFSSKDSIEILDSSAYFTSEGRKVFAGGGIVPDVFIPLNMEYNFEYLSKYRSLIPEFVYKYYSLHTDEFKGYDSPAKFRQRFQISNKFYNSFLKYAADNEVTRDDVELAKIQDDVKIILKAYIARQKWSNDGYYPVINEIDNTLSVAYNQMKKGYQALLK